MGDMCERTLTGERASVSRMLSDIFSLIFAIFWEGLWFKGDLTLIFPIMLANYVDVQEESLDTKLTSLKRKKSRWQKLQEWQFSLKSIDPDTRTMDRKENHRRLSLSNNLFSPNTSQNGLSEPCPRKITHCHGLNTCVPRKIYMLEI